MNKISTKSTCVCGATIEIFTDDIKRMYKDLQKWEKQHEAHKKKKKK